MRLRRTVVALLALLVTAGVLAACTGGPARTPDPASPPPQPATGSADPAVLPGSEVRQETERIAHRSVAAPPPMRLAAGLVPPTNRWFSGLVFGKSPEQVFPLPLAFAVTGGGFSLALPTVQASADTIGSQVGPMVTVGLRSSHEVVSAYDDTSATVRFTGGKGAAVGTAVVAEGSPVVSYTAQTTQTATLGTTFRAVGRDDDGRAVASADLGGTTYLAVAPSGSLSGGSVRLRGGQSVLLLPEPPGTTAPLRLADALSGPLRGVTTSYSVTGSSATTALRYRAAGGSALFATLPEQRAGLQQGSCRSPLGDYPTVYGTMTLCSGSTLAWSVPASSPDDSLDLSRLTAADRSRLVAQLRTDIGDLPAVAKLPADSYFGGKALYRMANLLQLARGLGQQQLASTAREHLAAAVEKWTTPAGCPDAAAAKCFVYDPAVRGIVGQTASFGSDQFNDHHFHYGYFLYAAAVLVQADPGAKAAVEPVMNLLAADLATSGDDGGRFPERRTFDPYFGHSWAAGYAPFADGNDEESSSEAVDAWNGLALWATATGQTTLRTEAEWMLSEEAYSAVKLWVAPAAAVPGASAFRHPYIGIDWGDKRDFASWFSPKPSAILAIQLVPMSPASTYLDQAGSSAIAADLSAAIPKGPDVEYGDYLVMFQALEGKAAARKAQHEALRLPAGRIDDGDSRSYLLAWTDSLADR